MLRHSIREDIALSLALTDGPLDVRADAGQVEQVLLNLAINARDAMPDGGEMAIATERYLASDKKGNGLGEPPDGDYAVLIVSDSGVGMEPGAQAHVFEPFYTTKEAGKGTGLGLATVFGTVKQHGGHVTCESAKGRGTSFRVYLPLSRAEGDRAEPAPQNENEVSRGSATVLLVEDDVSVRRLAERMLARQGYRVLVADDPAHALTLFEEAGHVDLLLTDVIMPGMKGPELFSRMAERQSDLRVLYMSGYTDQVFGHEPTGAEATNFIQKPFSLAMFTEKVAEVLDEEGETPRA